jgi:hypothetical protein
MVKATQSYHKRDLHRVVAAQITMARYLARQAIKAQLQSKGLRVFDVGSADISRAANEYMREHLAELMAEVAVRFLIELRTLHHPQAR